MEGIKQDLIGLFGTDNVLDDPASLGSYARDLSFVLSIRPRFVVRPGSGDEVQALIVWANKTSTPLVPVSSGSPHFYGDTVPSVPGAVIVDLSRLNEIMRIDLWEKHLDTPRVLRAIRWRLHDPDSIQAIYALSVETS